jgi:hypothetical protein
MFQEYDMIAEQTVPALAPFDAICERLKNKGLYVVAVAGKYDLPKENGSRSTHFSTRLSFPDSFNQEGQSAIILGTASFLADLDDKAQEIVSPANELYQAERDKLLALQADNWSIFIWAPLTMVHLQAPKLPSDVSLTHLRLDTLREVMVSWSNSQHDAKLEWREPAATQRTPTPMSSR